MNARDLSARLSDLLRREHHALADFLLALAAFDAKRHWIELGYPSLFTYLHRELGLSKSAAFYRKTAAELLQRFPELALPLEEGKLCLSTVGELAQVLTPENRDEVIPRFLHLSKQEARAVVAELKPVERPPQREVVTAVRAAPAMAAAARAPEPAAALPLGAPATDCVIGPGSPEELPDAKAPTQTVNAPISRREPPTFEPLTADLRRMHVTVTKRFEGKVAAARDALSHARPGASTEEILETALDLLLEKAAKRKGIVGKPKRRLGRRSAITFPRMLSARSGNGTAAAASSGCPTARSAAPRTRSSTTTSFRSCSAESRPSRTRHSTARRTTSMRRGGSWEKPGWKASPRSAPSRGTRPSGAQPSGPRLRLP